MQFGSSRPRATEGCYGRACDSSPVLRNAPIFDERESAEFFRTITARRIHDDRADDATAVPHDAERKVDLALGGKVLLRNSRPWQTPRDGQVSKLILRGDAEQIERAGVGKPGSSLRVGSH